MARRIIKLQNYSRICIPEKYQFIFWKIYYSRTLRISRIHTNLLRKKVTLDIQNNILFYSIYTILQFLVLRIH